MALTSAAADTAAANAVTALIGFISLHTASPGSSGASEYSGVTRQAVAWSAGANTGSLSFTTSGTTPVTHAGGFSLVTGGVYYIGFPLASSVEAPTIGVAPGALTLAAS